MNKIKFYRTNEVPYGIFSNFYISPFESIGITYKTSEHFYQAHKFLNKEQFFEVVNAGTPKQAALIGRNRDLRKDWEEIKNTVMFTALKLKFDTWEHFKNILISTNDSILIEDSPTDYYWGIGSNGTGKNMLGTLLMELRETYRGIKNV